MPAEEYNGFFRNFTPERISLPSLELGEMLTSGRYFGAKVIIPYLLEAEEFLINTPGDNRINRAIHSPNWFRPWREMLRKSDNIYDETVISESKRPILWNNVAEYIKESGEVFGLFNVAGGEGHEGHRYVAKVMLRKPCSVVWAFENDDYNRKYKERGGTFLDLRVRLSMWLHFGLRVVTVLPSKPDNVKTPDWYDSLFWESGAHTYFVSADDPHKEEKRKRVRPGYEYIDNVIPAYRPGSTTDRVTKIMPDLDEDDFLRFSTADEFFLPEPPTEQIDCTLI